MAEIGYKINGVLLPTPDTDPDCTSEDMHGKSWRDGAGKLHFVLLRRDVTSEKLKWHWLSKAEFENLKNLCRKDMGGTYTFESISGEVRTVYTGANLTYKKRVTDKNTGDVAYLDVALSFIEV